MKTTKLCPSATVIKQILKEAMLKLKNIFKFKITFIILKDLAFNFVIFGTDSLKLAT